MKPDLEIDVKCFNLKYTLECGQCFRWKLIDDNTYVGIVKDRVIKIKQTGEKIYIWSSLKEGLKEVVYEYFDLNTDYEKLEKSIAKVDDNIKKSLAFSSGIHILNQPLFETVISYIISANNNIKRISKSVDDISKMFGKKVMFEKKEYYLFPTLEELSNATMDDLLKCGTGFRARYILNNINELMSNPNVLDELLKLETAEARTSLMKFMGIGPKVADCILLFSLKKTEVFPVDVWVKRIMEKLYFKEGTSLKEISEYASRNYGKNAGIIQQHLFHNVRIGNI